MQDHRHYCHGLVAWQAGCALVALFASLMFGITGKSHEWQIALTYLGYAVVPFILAFVVGYYRSRFAFAYHSGRWS